ncbi:uncharacterized protein LOC126886178 [Diabrotica virgifera virgifera]|uniref:Tc1-like transposase DDE domain-containing protein n=1 Tax=Diabrotica virgifera virgifera TaxID=50390 RepID=A0ABM5KFQ7_DIAVI|nr:uncharacterized protein LOC126886178 [Diabrotica virgifera virgifera]
MSEDEINKVSKRNRRHPKSLDLHQSVKLEIKNIIYNMYKAKEHVTISAVLQKIKDKELCDISLTSLWRVLKHLGFRYKKTNNRQVLCELSNVVSKRWHFLRKFMNNKTSDSPRQVVFLDETWIFAKGNMSKSSWQDGTTKCYSSNRSSNGKRYIILHAGNDEGFIPDASLIFSSTKNTGDYHGNMDANIFEEWFEENLLKKLERPSIIVLDNASYHSRVEERFPSSSWTKEEIQLWLTEKKIYHSDIFLKVDLLQRCGEHKVQKKFVTDQMALKYGHEVLRLPPYHCHYNAIELVWGIAKNFYDKHASKTTDDASVLSLWKESLEQIKAVQWQNCIRHTEDIIVKSFQTERVIDEVRPLIIRIDNSDSDDSDSEISDSE